MYDLHRVIAHAFLFCLLASPAAIYGLLWLSIAFGFEPPYWSIWGAVTGPPAAATGYVLLTVAWAWASRRSTFDQGARHVSRAWCAR